MKHISALFIILFLSYFFSSCTESGPSLNSSEALPISTQVPAAAETATETTVATETKTAPPTEVPLFTEAEVEAANPFDDTTWPERFIQTQEHPELATEQQWQDEYQWILALREKDEIPTTAENNNFDPLLQNLQNALTWEQTRPDEVRAGKKIAIAAVEYRAMIKESKYFQKRISLSPNDLQGYNFGNIGPILGQNLDAERRPFDVVSGKLAGFGTIGGQNILLIETEDIDGHNILFPVAIYVDKGPTLLKGSKCVVTDLSYSNKHGGDSTYTLKYDTELGPLGFSTTGKAVSWEDLYTALGKDIDIFGGGYMPA